MKFVDEFLNTQSKDKANEIRKSLDVLNKHPRLVRKLAGLYVVNNKDLSEECNCFYDEMISNKIEINDIAIVAEYINFENAKLQEQRQYYEEKRVFDL